MAVTSQTRWPPPQRLFVTDFARLTHTLNRIIFKDAP